MKNIFIPTDKPEDWRKLLANPDEHWVKGKSARTLAHCWEDAAGFPPEIRQVLVAVPQLAGIVPLLIFPEWKVSLPGGGGASQNDLWILAKCGVGLVSLTVEGKSPCI